MVPWLVASELLLPYTVILVSVKPVLGGEWPRAAINAMKVSDHCINTNRRLRLVLGLLVSKGWNFQTFVLSKLRDRVLQYCQQEIR